MAIYGLNFNGTEIPDGFKRKFAARRRIFQCGRCSVLDLDNTPRFCICGAKHDAHYEPWKRYQPKGESGMARLVGIATSQSEMEGMVTQATNGSRRVFIVRRPTAGTPFYGIYVY